MGKQTRISPPTFALRFFRWFCHPGLRDYIEGDLIELYQERVQQIGKWQADIRFLIDVLLLLRPGIIKSLKEGNNVMNYAMVTNYFKTGWRNVERNKVYSILNVAGLALSMTCGILIFSLIKHHVSFDNFHRDSDRIYRIVTELHRDVIAYRNAVPSPLGEFFRNDFTHAEKVARIYTLTDMLVSKKNDKSDVRYRESNGVSFTETEFFDIFNFPLEHGNDKTVLSRPNTALLTQKIATKYFGDTNPIGEVLVLDNRVTVTVTGILKDLPDNTDIQSEIFVSYATLKEFDPWLASDTEGWGGIRDGMRCYTLLKPGVPPAEVEKVLQPYVKKYRPNSKNVHHYKLQPLSDVHFNKEYGGAMAKENLWILTTIGLFLMLTACVNFVNLATAQALKRAREVGVRKVLGSVRRQLVWQFLFETAIIVSIATVLSATASVTLAPYISIFTNSNVPSNLFSDPTTILFCLGLALVVTLLAGSYPALVLARFQPISALKGKLSQQSVGGFNTRRTLIVMQFAISQVLIIGTIVTMDQLQFIRQSSLGFEKDAIVMIGLGTDRDRAKMTSTKNEVLQIGGVEQASLCFAAPASQNEWGNSIRFDNSQEEVNFRTSIKSADADYISTFGLELVAGKNVSPSDSVREMLVNETLLKKLNIQSPEDAIGRMITANGGSMKAPIVGVLRDFHDKSFHEAISPVLITTYSDDYYNLAVKLSGTSVTSALKAIQNLWTERYPDQLFEYYFVDDSIAQFYDSEQTILNATQLFSFIAIFIGCLGLYGLVSFMATQKTKEIGIRKVLGGNLGHVLWIFGKEFGRLIMIAFLIAAPIGWWVMDGWLQDFEYKIEISVWTFLLAVGCTILIAAFTIGYRAIKTANLNPVNSLRSE
jgi:putative ABC transport system permease protein